MDKNQLAASLAAYFDKHFDEIISDLNEIMSIDSSFDPDTVSESKPFGNGSAAALEWGAAQGENLGLKVRNFDN